ncbi:hypothetical protein [Actinocrispum wychmicini]|uniref:Uncharacterized protein n=1 Tax=Actinocrispum wychmicini TaxID=1213861 RepID=A0A4V2S6S1_9PSEU|nr:hypothetical protein [Actinocrispum wychmicini]TCO57170.1 hypothetical protein EV192_106647 [Actinocrispum wychmicini]
MNDYYQFVETLRSERARLEETLANDVPLVESLRFAVPIHIEYVSRWDERVRQGHTREAATTIGIYGDALQFRGKNAALAFNSLARGLALLAYQPGGVAFAGLYWCVGSGHHGIATERAGEPPYSPDHQNIAYCGYDTPAKDDAP